MCVPQTPRLFFYKKNLILDAGNSGTLGRCVLGSLVRSPYKIKLTGDPSLSKRDFNRIAEPLKKFGVNFYPKNKRTLPLYIQGTDFLRPIKYYESKGSDICDHWMKLSSTKLYEKRAYRENF